MRRTQREEGSIEIQARAQADPLSCCTAGLHLGLSEVASPVLWLLAMQRTWHVRCQDAAGRGHSVPNLVP